MKAEFLGKHLDKTGNEVYVWFSNNTTQSPVLSLLFRTYSNLLDTNLSLQKFYWNRLPGSCVVWAEDKNKNILSGIVFDFDKAWRAGYLLTTFTDPLHMDKGINKICFHYYLEKSKENGMVRTLGLAFKDNYHVVKKDPNNKDVSWGGGKPQYIVFTDKI
jgi:hypothetical protein